MCFAGVFGGLFVLAATDQSFANEFDSRQFSILLAFVSNVSLGAATCAFEMRPTETQTWS